MTDRILIRDLVTSCIIGANPEERHRKQNVVINVALECDLSCAARSDQLEDTVDYKSLKEEILELVEDSKFFLLERLAGEIAKLCMKSPKVRAVEVTVDKPGAVAHTRSVAVHLRRCRRVARTSHK
ncbi:MAG: dihydroneopterin aldolase [Kiritimatiellia bacterium]